jgi:heme/copper-type cytochrome/quinol oxidase subunit 2
MKKLTPIFIVALIANLITFCFYFYAASQPGGSGLSLVFVLTILVLWVIIMVILIVLVNSRRKIIFKRNLLKWTIPVMFFCTPIPFLVLFFIQNPPFALYQGSTGYNPLNGFITKEEEWNYPGGKMAIRKYFKLNSEQYQDVNDSRYVKDSTWTYWDKNGDTIKIEWYKNGKLIKTVNKEENCK